MISLAPFPSDKGQDVLVAVDTLGNYFRLFVCTIEGLAEGNKIFLAKVSESGASTLVSDSVRFTVTGGVVDECQQVALVNPP